LNDSAGVLRNAGLIVALLILAACSRAGGGWGVPGEIRIAFLGPIYTLNPEIAFGQRLIDLTQLYTQPLVGLSPQNRAIPVLCTQIPSVANGGISKDGLTIVYHLRRVRFADNVPFTSKDVAFTYRVILDPRNPITEAEPYRRIASLETPDLYTVRIRLKAPWAGAVHELFAASDYIFGILPAHAFTSTDVSHAAWNNRPFGTGPFRVVQWNRGDSVVFERNPYAWQPPKAQRVVVKMLADTNTAFIDLQAHAVDFTDITYDQVARAQAARDLAVIPVPRNESDFVEFQLDHPAMADPSVREAIALAIDRASIARTIYRGLSPLATTEIPPVFTQHDGSIHALPFDPQRARMLLHGRHIEVHIAYNLSESVSRSVANVIQANLRAVGIDALQNGAAPSLYYAPPEQGGILYDGKFDLDIGGWYGGLDPEASEPWTCANRAPHGPNVARFCDSAYDAAFTAQQRALDPAARAYAFATMQRIVHERRPVLFLVYRTEYEGINPSLRGVAPNMLYNFGQVQEWSVP
jgi:peptide/nickel transport system substrate-binding protein